MSLYPNYHNNDPRPSYSDHDHDHNFNPYQNSHNAGSTAAINNPGGTSYPYPHSFPSQPRGNYSPVVPPDHYQLNPSNSSMTPSYRESSNAWLEKQNAEKRRSKMWTIGGLIGLVVLIAIGVGVGVAVSKNKSGGKGSSSSSGSSPTTGTTSDTKGWVQSQNKVLKYNPKDPSQFEKDSRLKKNLYGMAYMPEGAILPNCGATLAGVLEDVMLMSQLTTRLRIYGADCNQTALVLEAIKMTKVDMTVYLGIYINDDDNVYIRQRDEVKRIIQVYGTDHISGVTVGNEYVLNYLTAKKSDNPNSADGIAATTFLQTKIKDTRDMLASMSLSKTIPVGNGDAGSYTNAQLLSSVDYFMSNIHPWFGALPVEMSAAWTWQFFEENNVALAATTPNKPELFIAEVGWPTKSSDAQHATNGASTASVPNLQVFIDTWICQANNNGTKYFWFENMDQPWKDAMYSGVEGWWGLFDSKKQLKDVTLPDCPAP